MHHTDAPHAPAPSTNESLPPTANGNAAPQAPEPLPANAAEASDNENGHDKAKRRTKRFGMFCIQLAFLAGVCYVGNAVADSLPIGIPGNICSMVILLTLLISGMIAEEKIALISNFLLKYMPIFFIPAGVTIMSCLPLIQGHIPQFLLVCVLTTVAVFLVTSVTVIVVTRLQKYLRAKREGVDVHLHTVLSVQGDPRLAAFDAERN